MTADKLPACPLCGTPPRVNEEGRVYCSDVLNCEHGDLSPEAWRKLAAVDLREDVERLRASEQKFIDHAAYYRNLAIVLGAEPKDMTDEYDRKLCAGGLDPHLEQRGDNREAWDVADAETARADALAVEVSVLRSCKDERDDGNGPCGICVECLRARADTAEWEVARWVAWAKSSRCIYCGTVLPNPLDDEQEEADRVKRKHVASCEKHPLRTAEARADTAEKERDAIRERLDACEGEVQLFQPAYDLMNNLRLLAALREVMVESKKRDYTKSLEDGAVDSCFRCHRIAAAAIAEGEK